MALDWSKELSFSGLKRSSGKAGSGFPSKTHMNLVVSSQRSIDMRKTALLGIILLIVVVLFVKFGVFDFYARVDARQAELSAKQQELNALASKVSDYEEILAEYESYDSSGILESGLAVDALDALSLVDRCITPYASVVSLSLSEDKLTINVAQTGLDKLGSLVNALEGQDNVASVVLSTAASRGQNSGEVSATVTVSLQSSGDSQKEAA